MIPDPRARQNIISAKEVHVGWAKSSESIVQPWLTERFKELVNELTLYTFSS